MPSLNEFAYLVAERLQQQPSAPGELLLRQIRQTILHYRSTILRRDFTQNVKVPRVARQILSLPVTLSSSSGTSYRITKDSVPRPVRFKLSGDFLYVGKPDGSLSYTQVEKAELPFRAANRFTAHTPAYVYEGDKLELYNCTPTKIRVEGVFEDPRAVWALQKNLPIEFYDNDSPDFPLPLDIADSIISSLLNGEYKLQNPPASEQAVSRV